MLGEGLLSVFDGNVEKYISIYRWEWCNHVIFFACHFKGMCHCVWRICCNFEACAIG